MKISLVVAMVVSSLLPAAPAFAALPAGPQFPPDGMVVSFDVADATQVPGTVLRAGHYSLTLLSHVADRMILRVDDAKGKEKTVFLAVPKDHSFAPAAGAGPVPMKADKSVGKQALRGFIFPNGAVAEFVYIKSAAVALAKANEASVPAVDPDSITRFKTARLSHDDLEMLTLWVLTPTQVGPDHQAAIEARRYQAPMAVASQSAPPAPTAHRSPAPAVQVSSASDPPPPPAARPISRTIKSLPHTASDQPLLALAAGAAAVCAAGLALRRRRSSAQG